MENAHRVLIGSLKEHSRLSDEDIAEISSLRHEVRQLEPNADFIRQGDVSRYSVLVVSGIVGRYHLLADGRRQYLTFHIAGDLPDIQTLFIEEMDHGLCTIGPATIAFIPHEDLLGSFSRRPSFGFAIWRETLIDGAILREAITNNGPIHDRPHGPPILRVVLPDAASRAERQDGVRFSDRPGAAR